ncbi:rhodanese-like domain-containing protein [Tepidamorphus sp. 3E244]|uniref:rhodanese-like domain-containing protein n=1 Tax=Tepidamorphus sp. 3E244 TaxID=3385498 RepID=UPI0038FCFD31
MAKSMKDMVSDAEAKVEKVSPHDARTHAANGDVILDVREAKELENDGRISGSLHVPRGVLEAKACVDSEAKDSDLCEARDKGRVHVLCASGARATLAADTLQQMGYKSTVIEGGLKGWKDAGLDVS